MKNLFFFLIAGTGVFSAQNTEIKPFKIDSLKTFYQQRPLFYNSPYYNSPYISKPDSAIANLYKMPVYIPNNVNLYSALKVNSVDTSKYKMPNALEPVLKKEIASK
ncbi:hypothetical protein [Chryseobacterium oryzae]|uniref:Uncharacterized protein n=1 Tax=Chryseobacterium oryzae TaxID=2929799 RepID=A0ABY4BJC0_9FLAO|nr:hypothetical protein [Chryseobacterium oryzae]UOE39275.1 hypothetical protein MTP08_05750 [Chryseobacterium oryzae]